MSPTVFQIAAVHCTILSRSQHSRCNSLHKQSHNIYDTDFFHKGPLANHRTERHVSRFALLKTLYICSFERRKVLCWMRYILPEEGERWLRYLWLSTVRWDSFLTKVWLYGCIAPQFLIHGSIYYGRKIFYSSMYVPLCSINWSFNWFFIAQYKIQLLGFCYVEVITSNHRNMCFIPPRTGAKQNEIFSQQ